MNDNIKDFQVFGITGYTVMSTYHLRDEKLSLKAKGLLSLMLSLPKEWDYSINGLVKITHEGRDSIKTILHELKESEYIKISRFRDEKGHFRYKYSVYYLPFSKWLKMQDYPETEKPSTVEPETVNPLQLNNINNKIDKEDKLRSLERPVNEHNILTKELINQNFITKDDLSSFYYDDLFNNLLNEGNSYESLYRITSYIIQKVKSNNFEDEEGNIITNKFGYFKNSILSNINRFKNYSDDEDYNWLDDDSYFDYEL
ncbi:MAG: hypothetical protein IKF37_00460 [Bacilli bacterium]|nr:hypothetical protein [Bacilli bacterium]